jgi:Ca2+-binding RTX toxin-like protein
VLSGGEGRDTADFGDRTERLTIDLDGVKDDGESDERDNVQPDVERVIGGSNSDTLTGSSAANFLDGRAEEDTIEGGGGDDMLEGGKDEAGDTLRGENGRDTLAGGPGEDSLTGGQDDDTLTGGGGADDIDGDRGGDKVEGGPGGDALDGGEGDDSLYGGALGGVVGADGDDRLNGGRGADLLFGGRGNDLLDGGPEGDTISGEAGKDTVTYDDRTNPVRVSLNGIADDGEKGEGDNVANDVEVIDGGERDDTLSGDADRNLLNGGPGDDEIQANDGSDQLTGGKASDLLNARDGNSDVVDCEDDKDLAIADRDDAVRNCETVDRPGARHPIVGRYARVLREGEFRLRLPQGRRFFRLYQDVKIPIESTIDPRADDVRLVTARNPGARQVASVSAGRFAVRQRGRRRAVTELRLAGRLPDCRGSSTQEGRAKRAARSSPRRLRVAVGKSVAGPKVSNRAGVSVAPRKGKRGGGVEVLGKYSRGASTGTRWLTEDRCDGTLTTVISGTVRVRDFGRGRTVTVRPGKPYLAAR